MLRVESPISAVGRVIGFCRGPREAMAGAIHLKCVFREWEAWREERKKSTGGQEEQEGEWDRVSVVTLPRCHS